MTEALEIKCGSPMDPVSSLSGGNQQKIVLAKWLAAKSKIIIFDEPTRGIDVGAKVAVYELMNKLVEEGVGVIITSSEVEEVWNMSDKIVILKEGNMVGMFDSKELDQKQMQLYM